MCLSPGVHHFIAGGGSWSGGASWAAALGCDALGNDDTSLNAGNLFRRGIRHPQQNQQLQETLQGKGFSDSRRRYAPDDSRRRYAPTKTTRFTVPSLSQCATGRFGSAGSSSCSACPAGKFSDFAGAKSCCACYIAGHFAPASATSCAVCATGTSSAAGGAVCSNCSDTSVTLPPLSMCALGRFGGAGSSSCSACPVGKFSDFAGATSCCSCAAGRFSNVVGARNDTCLTCTGRARSAKGGKDGACKVRYASNIHLAMVK